MNGMAEKRDEWVGKGKVGVRITPVEASYMREWRLTWWPVYNPKAVAQQGSWQANLAIDIPLLRSKRGTNTPMDNLIPS